MPEHGTFQRLIVRGAPGGSVVVIRTPVSPNSDSVTALLSRRWTFIDLTNLIIFSFDGPWTLFWMSLGARMVIEWVLMGKNAKY